MGTSIKKGGIMDYHHRWKVDKNSPFQGHDVFLLAAMLTENKESNRS
jgi:hypothetical protein